METAFKTSDYPIVLSIENHCNLEQQRVMAQYFQEIFGECLCKEALKEYPLDSKTRLPSPYTLRRKILIKGNIYKKSIYRIKLI